MILNVEPGGCGAENAIPDSPSTSPVEGRSTAMPPKRPASASTAARWMSGSIADFTSTPSRALARATTRVPARRMPPGLPARRSSNSRSSPLRPTGAPSGTPRRASSSARSGGAGPTRPATSAASGPRSESRSGPLASGVPSRARMSPRVRQRRLARELLARAQAGEHELCAPVDRRRAVLLLDHRQADRAAQAAEDACLHGDRQVVGAVVRRARVVRRDLAQRHGLAGLAVGAHEALQAGALARVVGEQRVHRGVVAALPRGRPVARHRRRGRLVLGTDVDADPQCEQRDRRERGKTLGPRAPPPAAGGSRAGAGGCGHHSSMPKRPNGKAGDRAAGSV